MSSEEGINFLSRKKRLARKLDYLINIDGYRSYWGDWDIAREFISNAIDAEEGDWSKVSIKTAGDSLEVYNKSRSLEIKDLYFGNSSQGKGIDKNYIGRFNEGMKIAMAAAVRSGYFMTVKFGSYTAKPSIYLQDGIRALRISIEKSETPIEGTVIKIEGIKNIDKILSEKIIKPGDARIVTTIKPKFNDWQKNGEIQALNVKGIFVGGMYVCDNEGFAWGYNFSPSLIKMAEGRNIVDGNDVENTLGSLIQYAEDKSYWKGLFNRMNKKEKTKEGDVWPFIFDLSPTAQKNVNEAWIEAFGPDTVVEDELAREVEYRGGKVVKKNRLLETLVKAKAVPDSISFIRRYENSPVLFISMAELSEKELAAYDVICSIVLKYAPAYKLEIYKPLGKEKEGEGGFCSSETGVIGMNRKKLGSSKEIVGTLLEELTHAIYNTTDMSRRHADCIRLLAADMLFDDETRDYLSRLSEVYKSKAAAASK